ncbi:MAG: hypothetical protein Q9157_005450 [Trypethelium eluteriae]
MFQLEGSTTTCRHSLAVMWSGELAASHCYQRRTAPSYNCNELVHERPAHNPGPLAIAMVMVPVAEHVATTAVAPSGIRHSSSGVPYNNNDHHQPPIRRDTEDPSLNTYINSKNSTPNSHKSHHFPPLKKGAHKIYNANKSHQNQHQNNGTENGTAQAQQTPVGGFQSTPQSQPTKTTLTEISTVHPTEGQTGMWGEPAGPTVAYPPPPPRPSRPPMNLPPAVHFSKPKNNPQNWVPSNQHSLDYAEGGMSSSDHAHHFARSDYTFQNDVVALEFSDGVQNIECEKDHWKVQIKDQPHMKVAEQWPQDVTLMMFGFCNSGNGRLFVESKGHYVTGPLQITVVGEAIPINKVPKKYMRSQVGHYKPQKQKRDLAQAKTVPVDPMITPAPTAAPQIYEKRGLFGGFKSAIQGLTSKAGSVVSDATSVAGSAESEVTSAVVSVATQASSAISSVASEATSKADSVVSDVTSGAKSVESKVTSAVASVVSDVRNFNKTWGTHWHVSHPTASPTSSSPFGPAVTKLGTIHNLDIWDMGIGLVGDASLSGSLAIDFLAPKVEEAKVALDASEVAFNLPVGIVADASDIQHSFTFDLGNIEVVPPGFVLEGFAIGNWFELDLNITLGVKVSGDFDLGTNLTISDAKAEWDVLDNSNNVLTNWKPKVDKWFHAHNGKAEIKAALGFDVKYAFGYNITALEHLPGNKLFSFSSLEASLVESIAVEAKALIDIPDSKRKRDLGIGPESSQFTRNHPKDILRRELARFDTCDQRGGIPFTLSLADNIFMQAGLGALIGTKIPIWTWTTPLWSTCFENAQPKGHEHGHNNETHSNRTSPGASNAKPSDTIHRFHKGNGTGHAAPGDFSSSRGNQPNATGAGHHRVRKRSLPHTTRAPNILIR